MFKVTITRSAEKDIKRLDRSTKNRIVKEILGPADDPPRPTDAAKFKVKRASGEFAKVIGALDTTI